MPTTTETIPYQAVRRGARRRAEHVMREGITVGLIGAAVAMLLFLGVDLAAGAPLRTPAMLGNIFITAAFFVVVMIGLLVGMRHAGWFAGDGPKSGEFPELTLRQATIFFCGSRIDSRT